MHSNASIKIFEYFGFILLRKSFVSRYDSVALIFKMSIKLTKIAAQIIPTTRWEFLTSVQLQKYSFQSCLFRRRKKDGRKEAFCPGGLLFRNVFSHNVPTRAANDPTVSTITERQASPCWKVLLALSNLRYFKALC